MKNKSLLILSSITLAVILAATVTSKLRAPQNTIEKTILFPDLANRINDVSRVIVQGAEHTVSLQKRNGQWYLSSADDYPASFDKVRQTVINMSLLRLEEKKTDNPEYYSRLGVEDPSTKDASSLLVALNDSANNTLASLIIGKQRQSSSNKPGLYVRKQNEAQSLLVEGMLEVSDSNADWFERQLFDIPSAEVRYVIIQYADGNIFEISRKARGQTDFDIPDRDKMPSASKIIVNRIASGMEEMRADDVQAAGKFNFIPEETVKTTVTTFDGLVIESRLARTDQGAYGQFTARFDEPARSETVNDQNDGSAGIRDYARTLNNRLSGWVYSIPEFKYEALTTNIDDLMRIPGS